MIHSRGVSCLRRVHQPTIQASSRLRYVLAGALDQRDSEDV